MLLDQHRYDLEMPQFLGSDVLQHVADAGIVGMERLRQVGEGSGQLSGGPAVLLQQLLGEHRVRILDADFMQQD